MSEEFITLKCGEKKIFKVVGKPIPHTYKTIRCPNRFRNRFYVKVFEKLKYNFDTQLKILPISPLAYAQLRKLTNYNFERHFDIEVAKENIGGFEKINITKLESDQ